MARKPTEYVQFSSAFVRLCGARLKRLREGGSFGNAEAVRLIEYALDDEERNEKFARRWKNRKRSSKRSSGGFGKTEPARMPAKKPPFAIVAFYKP